jgi:hypothetical protein
MPVVINDADERTNERTNLRKKERTKGMIGGREYRFVRKTITGLKRRRRRHFDEIWRINLANANMFCKRDKMVHLSLISNF